MPEFIPGIQLNEYYYWEAVRPILDQHFPALAHTAALVGYGSDVIGFDTPVSRDHMWGPRMWLFLPEEDFTATYQAVNQALRANLPYTIHGYSTHFGEPDARDGGVRGRVDVREGPVAHLIHFTTLESFLQQELGIGHTLEPRPVDWLTFAEHRLLSLTGGKVYHDGLGLEAVRRRYAYYPQDVWLYLLAAQWALISQEEAFVGRTSQIGDELGSRVIAARLVERLMRLCFLMEKRYAPYSKWFGAAFQRLHCAAQMSPLLEGVLAASSYPEREVYIARAYILAAEMHNALGVTPPLEARTRAYSGWHMLRDGLDNIPLDDPRVTRPHQVIFGGRFSDALLAVIKDPAVLAFPPILGSVNQFLVESSDALQNTKFCRGLADDLSE